jgi:hypothetical protein
MSDETQIEWIPGKGHYLFRQGDRKLAYTRSHGDGRRWDVFDAGYRKLLEIPAASGEEAVKQVRAMLADGSLHQKIEQQHEAGVAQARRRAEFSSRAFVESETKREIASELHPKTGWLDVFLRTEIPMTKETHRLLRAVAKKRAAKIPGEQPSIGALIEELVDARREDLKREAGALYKKELAKKR